jgi:hypothetical protein
MLKIEITLTKPQLKLNRRLVTLQAALLALVLVLSVVPRSQADSGNCSGQTITLPFTDVMGNPLFCSIAQIFFQGITLGTTATTYSPGANVTRDQMAAFLARTQNSVLNRGSRRAAQNQFWTTTPRYTVTQGVGMLGTTAMSTSQQMIASDGADIWVVNNSNGVSRVRASDGKLLETWLNAPAAFGVLVAMGRIFVTGRATPGSLYVIDPSQPAGPVTTLSTALGNDPVSIAFDGAKLWTANFSGSVSIITPGVPFTVNNVTTGFGTVYGILYDGASIWVTELGTPGLLKKLDANGAIVDTVTVGNTPQFPIYDGTNIWVPNFGSNSMSVVRPSDGEILATLTGNGLDSPVAAAFDGQRILVTNFAGNSVSLFRAADFAPLGSFSTGASSSPHSVCSDGLYFWIVLAGQNKLGRF